jgi:hypothetical protein
MTLKGTEVESSPSKRDVGEEEDDRYEVMKFHGSKRFLVNSLSIDVKIVQEKLTLRDAIVIILAVSLSCLPNLIPPMLFGPIQSNDKALRHSSPFYPLLLLWRHRPLLLLPL